MVTKDKSKKKPRATQEERRAETAKKLIHATIGAIVDNGYTALRAEHITQRAGVTWGAAQHLFGNRDGLLLEVANQTSRNLVSQIKGASTTPELVDDRIDLVVRLTWRAYRSPSYNAQVEILRGSKGDPAFNQKVIAAQRIWMNDLAKAWNELFSPLGYSSEQITKARLATTLMLSGLASRRIYLDLEERVQDTLSILKSLVRSILSEDL